MNDANSTSGTTSVALGNGSFFSAGNGGDCSNGNSGTTWSTKRLMFAAASGASGVLDIDGDGYLDHVFNHGTPDLVYTDTYATGLRLGTPNGFIDAPIPSTLELAHSWNFDPTDSDLSTGTFDPLMMPAARWTSGGGFDAYPSGTQLTWQMLADVTGDGRPDLVMTYQFTPYVYGFHGFDAFLNGAADTSWQSWTGWAVFVNRGIKTGSGGSYVDFGSAPIRWASSYSGAPLDGAIQYVEQSGIVDTELVDVNGDGLLDRVFSNQMAYGNGTGFLAPESVPTYSGIPQWAYGVGYTGPTIGGVSCTKHAFLDLNGDGFLDRVWVDGANTGNWIVAFGNGSGFSATTATYMVESPSQGSDWTCIGSDDGEAFIDFNGDGVPDHFEYGTFGRTVGRVNLGALPGDSFDPNQPTAVVPGLLLRATDPMGGTVEFTYQTAPQMKDANGNSDNSGFSIPRPVVSRVRYLDGRAADVASPPITTTYHYAGGAYDYAEKEFRGFANVTATLVETGTAPTTVVTAYNTDRTCALNPSSRTMSSNSVLMSRETIHYMNPPITGGGAIPSQWGICLPVEKIEESIEGSLAAEQVSRTTWDVYDAFYNVTQKTEWGAWNLSAGVNIPGDERITTYTYQVASPTPSMVSKVKTVTVTNSAGTVFSQQQFCYNPMCTIASKGLTSRVGKYLTDPTHGSPDGWRYLAKILYDSYGNPTQALGPVTTDDSNGFQTTIQYDITAYNTFPVSVSKGSDTSMPLTTTLNYNGCSAPPAMGLPCSVTEPGNQVTNFQYDSFGRLTQVSKPASGYSEIRTYSLPPVAGEGQTILETDQLVSGQPTLVSKTFLDGLGRSYREESPGKSSETVIVQRSYDSRGRVATETLPYISGSPGAQTFGYDALGRLAFVADPDGVTTRVLVHTPWTITDDTYFGSTGSGANRQTRKVSTTDGLGRLVSVSDYADAASATTPYTITATYDPADRLLTVSDPIANNPALCGLSNTPSNCQSQTHTTSLIWDTLGRRVQINDPDSGTWNFQYDDAGLLKERTQSSGGSSRVEQYVYDELQRPLSKTFSPVGNGTANATFGYQTTSPTNPSYGQLMTVSSSTTAYTYGYDAAARVASVVQSTGGKSFTSMWTYDALDRIATHTFPDLESFVYGYDGLRLTSITGATGNTVYTGKVLASATYDAMGRIFTLGIGQAPGGAPIASLAYSYDPTSQRLTRVLGTPGNFATNDSDGDGLTTTDKCPYEYSLSNTDTGGVGPSSAPDGIGNACQCGDVDGDGRVTDSDASAILALGFVGTPLPHPELCDVTGDGACDLNDYYAIESALSSPPGSLQHCPPALATNVPSSGPVDEGVTFDGLGRLTDQSGTLGARHFAYDGLSRLSTATGPWEESTGGPASTKWTYSYDALGNLQTQSTDRVAASPYWVNDTRNWLYADAVRPHFLTQFAQVNQWNEAMSPTPFGEPSQIARSGTPGFTDLLTWNAQGKLAQYHNSSYGYDAFGQNTLVVTGATSPHSIVRVGDDFEYDITSSQAEKYFSVEGVRIAELATSYAANSASLPPAFQWTVRRLSPLGPPAAALVFVLGLGSLAGLALRKRPPLWLATPGVSLLSFMLVAWPVEAYAAASAPSNGPGAYGRPAEKFLAVLTGHLGSLRALVNQNGTVVETHDYDPFGADIAHGGVFSDQHRFTGQPADDQARGVYDYGARFYAPKYGRFLSPDEMTQGFDSQGLNPYAYALNAPTSHVDPDGHAIIDGVSFGAFSFGIVAQYDIQGRGPGQADQKFQIGWGGAHVPTASGYAKSIALGDAPIFSWGQPRWASPQLDPGDPDPGKVTTPNPDLRMTGGGLITFGALGFPEDAPLWLAGGLILGGWVLLNEGKSVGPGTYNAKARAREGAKSDEQLQKHLDDLKRAKEALDQLNDDLESAKGPKRKGAIREEIEDLQQDIKGHIKEIGQKWPDVQVPE